MSIHISSKEKVEDENEGKPSEPSKPELSGEKVKAPEPKPEPQPAQAPASFQKPQQQSKSQPAMNQNTTTQTATSLSGLMAGNTAPISDREIGGSIQDFLTAAKEMNISEANGVEINFLPLLRTAENGLLLSAIIATVNHTGHAEQGVGYHVMMIGGSASGTPMSRQVRIGNLDVEVQHVYGDAWDPIYAKAVQNKLAATFGNTPANKIADGDVEVVPDTFDFKDKAAVRRLVANAVHAASNALNSGDPDWEDLALNKTISTVVEARLAFHQPSSANAVGLPVRADTRLDVYEASNNSQQKQGEPFTLNRGNAQQLLSGVGGFIDLLYDPEVQTHQNPFAPAPQQQQQNRLYRAMYVITQLKAPVLSTLPGQLLNIATAAAALRENNNWVGSLSRPQGVQNYVHDIGAIGIEANFENDPSGYGSKVDTAADSFRPQTLAMLIAAKVFPELLVAVDVEETGPETWLNAALLAAANGSAEAKKEIVAAGNVLTNGHLGNYWSGDEDVVMHTGNRIHLGYYQAEGNVATDIRELDYLAMLNLRANDRQMMAQFSDTYTQRATPIEIRLHTRWNIIKEVMRTAVLTGFAQRLVINPKFLAGLSAGIKACKLPLRLITPYQDPNAQVRGQANWASHMGMATGGADLFGRTQQSDGNQGNPGFRRWN